MPHRSIKFVAPLIILFSAATYLSSCVNQAVFSHSDETYVSKGDAIPYFLPKAMVKLKIKQEDEETAKINDPIVEIVPDTGSRFWLQYVPSQFSNDEITFAINAKGLLQSVTSTTEDAAPAIVASLVDIAKDIALTPSAFEGLRDADDFEPFEEEFLLDPLDQTSIDKVNRRLLALNSNVRIAVDRQTISEPIVNSVENLGAEHSVYFHPLTTLNINFRSLNGANIKTNTLILPDKREVIGFNIHRHACVKNSVDIKFSEGLLTQVKLNKPSEFLGCLKIPSDVIKAIVGFPKLEFETQKGLSDAEKDLIESQTQLIAAQKALLDAQNAGDQ